ncbi:MAG: APC family permease [Myxococcaceae bacterium]
MTEPARRLTLLDCLAIGINGVVGSGVYLQLSPLAQKAGAASVAGIAVSALLCTLIALCFAELSGMFDKNGGSYLYARTALGPYVGWAVGWMSLTVGVTAFAAVAAGFGDQLSALLPSWGLDRPVLQIGKAQLLGKTLIALLLVLSLGSINLVGVRAGARTSTLLSIVKLVPLLLLAAVGVFAIRGEVVASVFSPSTIPATAQGGYFGAVGSAAFFAVFMLSGFEFTAVPAGEAQASKRNVPIAIVGSLVGAAVLYCVLQLVALSLVPDLPQRSQPLPYVANILFGSWGEPLIGVAALVSMAGFCAGSALVGPRYFTVLAEDGYLPAGLARISRFGTPAVAVFVTTSMAALLVLWGNYASLVDISTVALFGQYIPTSIAALVLRYRMPNAERTYRLPWGPTIPLLATVFSVVLMWKAGPRPEEWLAAAEITAVGLAVWLATSMARRIHPQETPT